MVVAGGDDYPPTGEDLVRAALEDGTEFVVERLVHLVEQEDVRVALVRDPSSFTSARVM